MRLDSYRLPELAEFKYFAYRFDTGPVLATSNSMLRKFSKHVSYNLPYISIYLVSYKSAVIKGQPLEYEYKRTTKMLVLLRFEYYTT